MLFMLMSLLSGMRVLLAPDNGAGEGGQTPPPSGAAAPGPNSGVGSPTPPATPPAPPPATPPPAAPPADIVSMPRDSFNERITSERNAGARELLTALGFQAGDPVAYQQSVTSLRDLLTFAKQQKEAQMTAEQRVQASLQEAQTQAQTALTQVTTLTTERDTSRAQLRTYVLRSQIVSAAAGAAHPEDVYTWALNNQREKVDAILVADEPLFADDGTLNPKVINADAVKAVIDECRKARHDWFKPGHPGSPSNGSAQPPTIDPKADQKRKAAASLTKF